MSDKRVRQFLNDFKSTSYCCKRIINLNMELEVMNHQAMGLSHKSVKLTKEQMKSKLPMPVYHQTYTSPLALLEEISKLENEVNYYRRSLMECKAIELLDDRDKNILYDLYFFDMTQDDVADKYGYNSSRGLRKHIKSMLSKLI